MIHAFGLEPDVVAAWARREEYRVICDKFGLGTPRVLLELPVFTKWKRAVYGAATTLGLSEQDMHRLEVLFKLFEEHKCRGVDSMYNGLLTWLENAEREYTRRPYAGILATSNPREHPAVLTGDQIGPADARWAYGTGVTVDRTPQGIAAGLSPMLLNAKELHLVDPNFGPENARHRNVLQALLDIISKHGTVPDVIRVHCSVKSDLAFFETEAAKMGAGLPRGMVVEFARLERKPGGDWFHKRYVLTDLGGVMLGDGLDEGRAGETDDLLLLPRPQYELRWAHFVTGTGFVRIDAPASVHGTRPARSPTREV